VRRLQAVSTDRKFVLTASAVELSLVGNQDMLVKSVEERTAATASFAAMLANRNSCDIVLDKASGIAASSVLVYSIVWKQKSRIFDQILRIWDFF